MRNTVCHSICEKEGVAESICAFMYPYPCSQGYSSPARARTHEHTSSIVSLHISSSSCQSCFIPLKSITTYLCDASLLPSQGDGVLRHVQYYLEWEVRDFALLHHSQRYTRRLQVSEYVHVHCTDRRVTMVAIGFLKSVNVNEVGRHGGMTGVGACEDCKTITP